MQILYWPIDTDLKIEAENNYRTNFALKLVEKDPLTIIRNLTFDGVVPNIKIKDIENLLSFIEFKFLNKCLAGVGLELGAGPAVFSSILARRSEIYKMYAVEICQSVVEVLAPKIVTAIAGPKASKVICCVGDFNRLAIPDQSVDFIFDFFSLHHSYNPTLTLRESYRVLKKGGFILALDKARPDYLTNGDIERLLDKEYDGDFKKRFCLSLDKKLTRQENGEKEYRLREWRYFFAKSGFKNFFCFNLDKCIGPLPLRFIKSGLAKLPVSLQVKLTPFLPRKNQFGELSKKNRIFSPILNSFRKEMSLMIAYK